MKLNINRDLDLLFMNAMGEVNEVKLNKGDVPPGLNEVTLITSDGRASGVESEAITPEPLPMTFSVLSSWGELVAEAETGKIIDRRLDSVNPDDATTEEEIAQLKEYHNILTSAVRFDVEEWRKQYPGEEIGNKQHDILDLGIFFDGGKRYDPPSEDWRAEFRAWKANRDLPIYLMTDQPPQCPKCGVRPDILQGAEGREQLCECPKCKYRYILEADEDEP